MRLMQNVRLCCTDSCLVNHEAFTPQQTWMNTAGQGPFNVIFKQSLTASAGWAQHETLMLKEVACVCMQHDQFYPDSCFFHHKSLSLLSKALVRLTEALFATSLILGRMPVS